MRTLFVLAHQDDEAISCGGLIQKRTRMGENDKAMLMTVFGRKYNYGTGDQHMGEQLLDYKRACICLGLNETDGEFVWLGLEEGEPNQHKYYTLLKHIEDALKWFRPTEVVTHSPQDLNQDHRFLNEVVNIALRSANLGDVRRILYCHGYDGTQQASNLYVPLSAKEMSWKLHAIGCYSRESRQAPHPRSEATLLAQHTLHGSQIGQMYAEGYTAKLIID